MAQNLQLVNQSIPFQPQAPTSLSNVPESTTLNCVDTINFPIAKATSFQVLSLNNATSAYAASQYYNAPQAITISGATFYAYKANITGGISANVPVSIYLAGPDSLPTGTPLATTAVAVDTAFGAGAFAVLLKTATFSTPVTMTQPYCIVVENNSPNSINVVYNSFAAGDGRQQWLAGANIGGNWLNSYSISIGGNLLDADLLIYPHVSYDLTASFTANRSYMCAAGDVTFTDNSSAILKDPMYNRAAFVNAPVLSYSYNFGDGSPTAYGIDTTYTYATAPPYTVVHYDTIIGWRKNCMASDTIVLAPIGLTTTTNTTLADCNLSNGSATISPLSGQAPYTYLWDAAAGNQSTAVATGLSAGSYTATFTDNDGCTGTDIFIVGNPGAPSLGVSTTSNYNGFPISCNGASDGAVTATATGGTGAYSYLWGPGAGNLTTPSITGLAAGTYGITVTDGASCSSTALVTLVEPTALSLTSNNIVHVSCNGGSDGAISTNAAGGITPYAYLWNNSTTTDSLIGLSVGAYTVTLTDANGCIIDISVSINQPSALATTLVSSTDILCNGDSTGSISMNSTGGTAPYTYSWSNGATTDALTGLPAGTYTVTATDANGCEVVSSAVSLNQPTLPLTSTATDNGDGTATVLVNGGAIGLNTYQWDAAAGNQTTATATGLVNNTTYSVTVTDVNGCTSVSTVTVTIVGISNIAFLNNLSVFPIPASTNVFVDLDMTETQDVSIRILNVTGQTVLTQNVGNIQSQRVELNTAQLTTGVYMMHFNIGAEKITRKLIIE